MDNKVHGYELKSDISIVKAIQYNKSDPESVKNILNFIKSNSNHKAKKDYSYSNYPHESENLEISVNIHDNFWEMIEIRDKQYIAYIYDENENTSILPMIFDEDAFNSLFNFSY